MNITLKHIGKSAGDLRFFILKDGVHAGGITMHSIEGTAFSYGVAIAKEKRRQGVARAGLELLFADMRKRGFDTVVVQIEPDNAASLALHRALGFRETRRDERIVTLTLSL